MDGYHNNMGDLRDFIEQWMSKLETSINTRIIESILKHFQPQTYGTLFEIDSDLSRRITKVQQSVETLNKLYRYILHRRILEGKEKQANLGTNRLNMGDVADINMIERRCVQIESNVRFLKYMKWFVDTSFFVKYHSRFKELEKNHNDRQTEKRQHYKNNLMQMIKNLVLVDNLFIDKVFEESNVKGDSPKASYGSLLKNSKFSNLNYAINKDEEEAQPERLQYPLKGIEEFIVLLKATNVNKIKDYIILYTLLDMGYSERNDELQSLLLSLNLHDTFKEIRFYWRLENSYTDKTDTEFIKDDLKEIGSTNSQWSTSVLQTLLELKNYEVALVYMCSKDLNLKQQKSIELIIYGLCASGKYNQAFLILSEIEDEVNPIRYKNLYRMFVSHILMNKEFELLCSYHMSEKQEELVKELLRSHESGLNQLYYLSFIASRGSTLEGLKHAKEFFEKLKKESEDIRRAGAEEAGLMCKIVGMLIKMHSHTLPAVHKKFAFEYLKLEKGKYQVALSTKFAKEGNIQLDSDLGGDGMDVDYDRSVEDSSDQGNYTPFLNRQVDQMINSRIPKTFEDPFRASVKKPVVEGTKSIIKAMKEGDRSQQASHINPFEPKRANLPRQESNFLTSQKRDHLFEGMDEEIVYQEEEEDIAAGKVSTSKFLNDLKNKRAGKPITSGPVSGSRLDTQFPQRSKYADMDLADFNRQKDLTKKVSNQAKQQLKSGKDSANEKRITKESLLASLPERVKNIKTEVITIEEEKEEPPKRQKSPSPEPESLMINVEPPSSSKDVQMQPEQEEESDSESEEQSEVGLIVPQPRRRMSFEHQKPMTFERPLDQEMMGDMDILMEPHTTKPSQMLPHFTAANDDIELIRRKREAKERRVMGFLYAGDLPYQRAKNYQKHHKYDVNVGSDYTPEKEEEPHREKLKSPMRHHSRDEEDKDYLHVSKRVRLEQESEGVIAQSEVVYDDANPLNAKISNRSIKDTIRSESAGIREEDRQTEGANLLEKVKRIVQKEAMPPLRGEDLHVVQEVISERSDSKSVVESIVMSSDQSVAAPPSPCPGSEPDVVCQAVSSKSGEEALEESDSDICVEEPSSDNRHISPIKTRQQRRKEGSSKKYKGSGKYEKKRS